MSYQSKYTGSQIDDVIGRCIGENLKNLDDLKDYNQLVKTHSDILANHEKDIELLQQELQKKLPLTGGTITEGRDAANHITGGQIKKELNCEYYEARDKSLIRYSNAPSKYSPIFSCKGSSGDISMGMQSCGTNEHKIVWRYFPDASYNEIQNLLAEGKTVDFAFYENKSEELASLDAEGCFLGACWNDYAEFRASDECEPGRVVCENGDGTMSRAHKRLQPGAMIVSDTYGFAIGKMEQCQTPIAVSGRVLAYPYEDWWTFEPGEAVCAGPNGTVSKMTRREIRKYPERIIGTVSELPLYEVWGTHNTQVNGRIWIKVK